jgi:lipoprotein-anchoring transpeptidase ErfK/SrfK
MRRRLATSSLLGAVISLTLLASAAAAPAPVTEMTITLSGLKKNEVAILKKVTAKGTLEPATPGEEVVVSLVRSGDVVKTVTVGAGDGTFRAAFKITEDGPYKIRAEHIASPALDYRAVASDKFGVRYPSLRKGDKGAEVALFNDLLRKQRYLSSTGSSYTATTGRGVMAFRKVNKMKRSYTANADIFKKLAGDKGGYKVQHPGSGRHAEVSLRRQILVLAQGGKVQRIFHVSTGASSTPTIRGHFRFYRREPGYNSKGMYYSFYFIRGYAIHGYKSVPAYPASHGCVRTPIADQKRIYNWLKMGNSIFVS